jgi:hypothetical protein
MGEGWVGCSPNELAKLSGNGVTCVERINAAIRIFNEPTIAATVSSIDRALHRLLLGQSDHLSGDKLVNAFNCAYLSYTDTVVRYTDTDTAIQ